MAFDAWVAAQPPAAGRPPPGFNRRISSPALFNRGVTITLSYTRNSAKA